ncbi:MAG: DapH/DapD/GlmU-related protein [bacterium]
MQRENPQGDYPHIDTTAYIDPTAVIIGRVVLGKNVFIGPGAVIRADEPESSITVRDNCNIQDRVIMHALKKSFVLVEENTSLAHGCIVHGPCRIGKNCFIGFGSVVFKADICKGVVIKHLSCIEGVTIPPEKVVESCTLVNSEDDVKKLGLTDREIECFTENVIKANLHLVSGYKKR